MIALAGAVLGAVALGIFSEQRVRWARTAANRLLTAMLYGMVPFVSYVNIAHLKITAGVGVGLIVGYVGVGMAGIVVWWSMKRIGAGAKTIGGMILCVILINTGYMGDPMTIAVLGSRQLPHALAFDQLVGGPMLFTAGFAVAGAFGEHGGGSWRSQLKKLLTRNPPLVAAVLGLMVPAAWAPEVLVHISHVIIYAMLVGGFFAVGVTLSDERRLIGGRLLQRPDRPVAAALIVRFTVAPAVLVAVALAGVGVPSAYILQSLMPSGLNGLILGNAYGLDVRRITDTIVWSTLAVLIVGVVIELV